MQIEIVKLPHGSDLPLPKYATEGSAGMDLFAAISDKMEILPGSAVAIPTGIAIALPPGYEGQVRPRSGFSLNNRIGIVNSPGTVDSDYRGEIKVPLINFSDKTVLINRGDRIAQLVIARYEKAAWREVDQLPDTKRADGGFGHSGK